jgi:hypothetical protein
MAALSEHFLTLCERIELFELDCLPMITWGMALLGVSCLATTPAFCGIYAEMKNQFGAANPGGGGDASSGVGSGGGDSGCGGGD